MVDLSEILNISVKTGPFEHMQGRGTVIISTGIREMSRNGVSMRGLRLKGVMDPYQVLKDLQAETDRVRDEESDRVKNSRRKRRYDPDEDFDADYDEYHRESY